MLIETLMLLAAAGNGYPDPARDTRVAAPPAVIDMTYNAFVATEESPGVAALVQPALLTTVGRGRVIVGASDGAPIS